MTPVRAPTFEVHQLKSTPRWYVKIVWPYGQEQHVTGFVSADDAKIWISRKSEGWLRNRNAALQSEDYQKSEGSPTHNGHPLRPTLAVTRFGSAIHQC
jgi:hypothetical protein